MSVIRTSCNHKMLKWARDEIGISEETLQLAESGKKSLTLNQLRNAAEKYDCPFGYFYFDNPPHEKTYKPIPDYRINPGHEQKEHYRLNLELKKARDHRDVFLDLLKTINQKGKIFITLKQKKAKNISKISKSLL